MLGVLDHWAFGYCSGTSVPYLNQFSEDLKGFGVFTVCPMKLVHTIEQMSVSNKSTVEQMPVSNKSIGTVEQMYVYHRYVL